MRRALLVVPLLLLLALPGFADGAAWSRPATFADGANPLDESSPRVGVAPDGTVALAFTTSGSGSALKVALRRGSGRFGPARTVTRQATSSVSVAAQPGGVALVVWTARDGVHAARLHGAVLSRRLVAAGTRSDIDDVQVQPTPAGGFVVLADAFRRRGSAPTDTITVQDLTPAGAAVAPPVALGPGGFGTDARPTFALAVDGLGTAVAAYRSLTDADRADPASVVRVRPAGQTWSAPQVVPVVDARVTASATGGAVVTGTRPQRCGDVDCFGAPGLARVTPAGVLGPLESPSGVVAGRSFGPSAVALGGGQLLSVFNARSRPRPFDSSAPVRAAVLDPSGGTRVRRTLTTGEAQEPVVVPLRSGGAQVIWSGPKGWGAFRVAADGRSRATRPPAGPPPTAGHANPTNRDIRSAGPWVAVAWDRGERTRVSVLRAEG